MLVDKTKRQKKALARFSTELKEPVIYLIVELIFENSQFGFKVLRFSTR